MSAKYTECNNEPCSCVLCRKNGRPPLTPGQKSAHTRWLNQHVGFARKWEAKIASLRRENPARKQAVVDTACAMANGCESSAMFEALIHDVRQLSELWESIHGLEKMLAERREMIGNAYVPPVQERPRVGCAPDVQAEEDLDELSAGGLPPLAKVIPLFRERRP